MNITQGDQQNLENGASQIQEQPERAINLITYDQKDGFQVSQDAIELLQNIKEKIGIIAVAGKYRTGKSFLLNRIILNKKDQNGFGVGPTINPCTKGLWIWNKPIEIESKPGEPPLKVFIVDSEGIGAFNEDQNHDTRIFLLALLLSSYFVYNSMGTIDENALQNLSLIVNLSKQLQIKNQKAEEADPDDVAKYFPSFLWVVRDFALRLLDQYGNPINSKEYLENSLKEQKGTSDNIEKKNKIRRLILNFFKDRDCYTMVRPTEEEKDLQNLQQINDESLRPEFIDQMTTLRARIFKRVKPKVLNGRFITGEMFLELCQSYVTAINKGSVPCIESAWTYLCQNECQRAIQEAIQLYEKEINGKVFLNFKKTDCVNYNDVKQIHKKLREESLIYFKDKAVGQNLKEFEGKILDEIAKKYQIVKQKCMQIYESKCQELIKKDVENIEQQIRQDLYVAIPDFNKEIDQLKSTFTQLTASVTYNQKDSVIKGICEKLIMKGYESIFRKEKELLTNQNRQLTEKSNFLEKDLQSKKSDFESERNNLQNKLIDIQGEQQNLRANNKIYEEKLRLLEVERSKLESQLQDKVTQLNETKENIENQLQTQIKDYQLRLKNAEDSGLKSQIQYEKDQALKEQKLSFMERDNQNLTYRVEQLFNENRQLLEKIALLENQLKQSDQHSRNKDEEKKKEIEIMKEFFQKKIDEGKSSETTVSVEKQRQWEQEKQFLQEQLSFSQKHIEENKKMHEVLLQAINSRSQDKDQDSQLLQVNKNLSETIGKVEQRNQQLQQKLSLIKIYQRVFKHSQSMQCKFCQVFFPSEIFVDHVKSCNKDNRYTRSHFFQIPLSISIQQTRIDMDPLDNRQYTEYVVQINFNDKTWVVCQKYKAFCTLHEKLINQYPNIKFPQSSFQFSQKTLNDFGNIKGRGVQSGANGGTSLIEDRRKILQQYLQDLALIPAIKESPQLKQFLDIHNNFPEFCDDIISVQNQIISNQHEENSQLQQRLKPANQLGGNFKIMNDLFSKQAVPQQAKPQNNQVQNNLLSQLSQGSIESSNDIRQQLSRKFDFEIEDILNHKNVKTKQQIEVSNVSNLMINKTQNQYKNIQSNSSQITPQKLQDFNNLNNQLSSQENLITDPDNQYVGDLSSIEGVLIDEEQQTRFLQDDEMNIGDQYEEDQYQYNQKPLPSESPIKSGIHQNTQLGSQQSRNNQQMYKSVLVNGNGSSHNHMQSQMNHHYHAPRLQDNQISHNEAIMKKSTSSNNLMYSPSQIQTSQMTSVLFNDKTNHNMKQYPHGSINQLPSMKENCVACHQKKIIEDELRSSQDRNLTSNDLARSQTFDKQYMTSSSSNFATIQSFNQNQNHGYSNLTQQKNATLLEELVQKCNNKAKDFGNVAQQRSQLQKQKLDSFVTPRDNTGTLLGNLINNANGNSNNYIKTEQAMRSDKILQDLLMRDKATPSAQSQNKRITPVKNSASKPQFQQNPYGMNNNGQTLKSPFSGHKQSNAGLTHQSSANQLVQSGTPDNAQKRHSMLSNQTSSYKKQNTGVNQSDYNNSSLKKSQTSISQFDQRSMGGRSTEKIRGGTQLNFNNNL
eukprot:403332245